MKLQKQLQKDRTPISYAFFDIIFFFFLASRSLAARKLSENTVFSFK